MKNYDYRTAMIDDIREAIANDYDLSEYESREEAEEALYNALWIDDSVTGNGSGSYTFNTYEAEENLCHNLELLDDAVTEFGGNMDILKDGAEACDVIIRCYLLGECLAVVLDEIESNGDAPEAWEA